MPVLGQHQHSPASFPGAAGVQGIVLRQAKAVSLSDALGAAAFPRSGTVTLSHSPAPCPSLTALASD